MGKIHSHYEDLKIARDAPAEVIRASYHVLSLRYSGNDSESIRVRHIIDEAFAVLGDPAQRNVYDAHLTLAELEERQRDERTSSAAYQPSVSVTAKSRIWAPVRLFASVVFANPLARLFAVTFLLIGGISLWERINPPSPPPPPKPYDQRITADSESVPTSLRSKISKEPIKRTLEPTAYVRPARDPHGAYWPVRAGYLFGVPIGNNAGNSKLTIQNGSGDAYAKLVAIDGQIDHAVREFFIGAGQTFTLENITPGLYDVRYEELTDGGKQKTDPISLTERDTSDGVEFSSITITLYAVPGGTMRTHPISNAEF